MKFFIHKYKSPIGQLLVIADRQNLYAVTFICNLEKIKILFPDLQNKNNKIIKETCQQLDLYFTGKLKKFKLPIKLIGTDFQIKAWRALIKIPYGKTITYQQQSQTINKPKANRAVGTANSKNPLCIILPCHRVIASDGSLGGYAGGLKIKQKLLQLESSNSSLPT